MTILPLQRKEASLLTMHAKERVIAPLMEEKTGCRVIVCRGYDTDQLGTFSMDIPRPGTQLETARAKAKIGMALSETRYGLASEGSFSPHPACPILTLNLELVLFIDSCQRIEVLGQHAGLESNHAQIQVSGMAGVEAFAVKAGFPSHLIMARPAGSSIVFRKGISTWAALEEAVWWGLQNSPLREVILHTDMRAHANPTRMKNIEKATYNLIDKIMTSCPRCGMMGYSISSTIEGAPCASCGRPTDVVVADVYICQSCCFREEQSRAVVEADPGQCLFCNP